MGCISGEVDYDFVESNVEITATGVFATEFCRVTVPALDYPVYLLGDAHISADSGTTAECALSIIPAGQTLFASLMSDRFKNLETEANWAGGRHLILNVRLPPNSPGDYVFAGTDVILSSHVVASANQPAFLAAFRR